jgi:Trk-type K+ transport system membrane component
MCFFMLLCGYMFSSLLDVCTWVELQRDKIILFTFLRTWLTFLKWLHHLTFPTAMYENSSFSHSLQHLL